DSASRVTGHLTVSQAQRDLTAGGIVLHGDLTPESGGAVQPVELRLKAHSLFVVIGADQLHPLTQSEGDPGGQRGAKDNEPGQDGMGPKSARGFDQERIHKAHLKYTAGDQQNRW